MSLSELDATYDRKWIKFYASAISLCVSIILTLVALKMGMGLFLFISIPMGAIFAFLFLAEMQEAQKASRAFHAERDKVSELPESSSSK